VIRLGRVVLLALLAAACATPARIPPAPGGTLPPSWEVRGRLAVSVADEAWHGTFLWRHGPVRQQVDLAGPLGQGSARLLQDSSGATLDVGDGEVLHGPDTGALLERHFGWSLPFDGLRHWIGGQADPRRPATPRHDDAGRLVFLEQDGWRIAFDRYRAVDDGGALPHRVKLAREGLEVRLVIDAWRLRPGAGGGA
jgi:outer membrane lipoprotein LolB